MTNKLKIALITSLLAGSFSYSYAGWFSSSTDEKAREAYSNGKYSDALLLYKQACNEGNFESCNDVGAMYKKGIGSSRDISKAKYFYTISCNNRNDYGCSNLRTIDRQNTSSISFNESLQNCNTGSSDSCGRLGVHYFKGEGVRKNLELAEKYLQQSCNAGNDKWCVGLGIIYYGKKDYFEAFKYFSKSCNAGDSESCLAIGKLYEYGEGTRLDIVKAADFYGKSCDLKLQEGCDDYKRLKSPQPTQQAINNASNSNYQQEQLAIQRQQLAQQKKQYEEQQIEKSLNNFNQSMNNMAQQNMQYLQQDNANRQLKQINNNLNNLNNTFNGGSSWKNKW